jgi:precorrin-6A/cobalt-precorrin-6A reductase
MTLLVLAGTAEARDLLGRIAALGLPVLASLAGATRQAQPLAVPTRIGGFGGAGAQAEWMRGAGISRVLIATHPFATQIAARTVAISRDLGLPCLLLRRPGWTAQAGDRWTWIDREEETAALIPVGATVFLATGRQTLAGFAGLAGRRLICRQIDPPDAPFPFPGGRFLVGRPPFAVTDEVALFRELGIDWLVVKDAGGPASRPKLDAARALGLPVAMIRRPPAPEGVRIVETVEEALAWLGA